MIVYNSLVESVNIYCIIVFDNILNNIQDIQNTIIKIILKKLSRELYAETKLLIYLYYLYCIPIRINSVRQNQRMLHIERSISYFAPKLYNIVPLEITKTDN